MFSIMEGPELFLFHFCLKVEHWKQKTAEFECFSWAMFHTLPISKSVRCWIILEETPVITFAQKVNAPGDSMRPFYPPVGGHLTFERDT